MLTQQGFLCILSSIPVIEEQDGERNYLSVNNLVWPTLGPQRACSLVDCVRLLIAHQLGFMRWPSSSVTCRRISHASNLSKLRINKVACKSQRLRRLLVWMHYIILPPRRERALMHRIVFLEICNVYRLRDERQTIESNVRFDRMTHVFACISSFVNSREALRAIRTLLHLITT